MSRSYKKNPRSVQVTLADIQNAAKYAAQKAIQNSLVIFFMVLADKEGFKTKDLKRIYMEIDSLSQSLREGYVSMSDLKNVLKEEHDIKFEALRTNRWLH